MSRIARRHPQQIAREVNWDVVKDAVEAKTSIRPEGRAVAVGGGCINEAFRLGDFFVKLNRASASEMFEAEASGLDALARSGALRVPRAHCWGVNDAHAYLVLEYLPLIAKSPSAEEDLGRGLAALHRTSAERFGLERDNFIGASPQPNGFESSWITFLRRHRFGHMLELARAKGLHFQNADTLLEKLESFFENEPNPSLLHGDLWGGNASALADDTPVVFDPAVYFGDREADLAMTHLFGGFSSRFYAAYDEAWPLPEGHQERRDLYNLYHILNHAVLFGGGYAQQAQRMIDQLGHRR